MLWAERKRGQLRPLEPDLGNANVGIRNWNFEGIRIQVFPFLFPWQEEKQTDMDRNHLLLYAVTPQEDENILLPKIERALAGGVTLLQLREKRLCGRALEEKALAVKRLCDRYKVPLVINDNVELAQAIGAAGVHLGAGDMPVDLARRRLGNGKIIGATARTVEQALAAQAAGADYLGSGAVFATSTKADAVPMPHGLLGKICRSVQIPVVAIGGIDESNIAELQGLPIFGVAVAAGIFGAADVKKAAENLARQAKLMLGYTGEKHE
jgi:thiamine-phosphate pyrophosphorylase